VLWLKPGERRWQQPLIKGVTAGVIGYDPPPKRVTTIDSPLFAAARPSAFLQS